MPTPRPKAKRPSSASTPRKRAPGTKARSEAAPQRATGKEGARLVDEHLRELGGWRAKTLAEVRRLIREADPEVEEDIKWRKPTNPAGVPVWSHAGIVCTGEAYPRAVKLTFARGAALDDPRGLFNAGLGGGTRRAIDIGEGDALDAKAFKDLVRAAVAENLKSRARRS